MRNTRSDALLGGISYCAEGVYRAQAFIYNSGCAPTDGACMSGVISHFGFPTVITGIGPAPYPGFNSEDAVLPALTGYRLVEEIDIAPGVVVRVWARLGH
jgi:hypothetical protein